MSNRPGDRTLNFIDSYIWTQYVLTPIIGCLLVLFGFGLFAWYDITTCGMDDFIARFHDGYQYGHEFCSPQN